MPASPPRASHPGRPPRSVISLPIGVLFASFLGYNPIQQLLGPSGALQHLNPHQVTALTGHEFFPALISSPFAQGVHYAFDFAIACSLVAAAASWMRGGKYVYHAGPIVGDIEEGWIDEQGLAVASADSGSSAAGAYPSPSPSSSPGGRPTSTMPSTSVGGAGQSNQSKEPTA